MIRLDAVSKSFGSKRILKEFSFDIPDGEICFVLGKSGTGKSVLLKNILGLMPPDKGKIFVDEFSVTELTAQNHLELFKRCGIVFQFPALLDFLTVSENIMMGLPEFSKMTTSQCRRRSLPWLTQVGLDDAVSGFLPTELSIGVQKRVAIARALAVGPRHLLFDEPTTGLDPVASDAIHALIRNVSRLHKMTAVVVSHDLGRAIKVADRIFLIEGGEIAFRGSPAEFTQCTHPTAVDFLQATRRAVRERSEK